MAHSISNNNNGFYTITFDPTIEWDSLEVFTAGMRIMTIEMAPNAESDAVVVRDTEGGPRIFSHEAVGTYDIAIRHYRSAVNKGENGRLVYPHIAAAEAVGTFDITFELA